MKTQLIEWYERDEYPSQWRGLVGYEIKYSLEHSQWHGANKPYWLLTAWASFPRGEVSQRFDDLERAKEAAAIIEMARQLTINHAYDERR
jgi:hypothetical protein